MQKFVSSVVFWLLKAKDVSMFFFKNLWFSHNAIDVFCPRQRTHKAVLVCERLVHRVLSLLFWLFVIDIYLTSLPVEEVKYESSLKKRGKIL